MTTRRSPASEGICGNAESRSVTLAGLATDFCVAYSALDAARLGFRVRVVEDACRAIDLDGSLDAAKTRMRDAGVALIDSGTTTR